MSGSDLFIAISLSGHARFQLHSYRGTFAQKVPGELLKLPAPRCRESSRQGKGLFVVVRSLTHAASCGECARYSCSIKTVAIFPTPHPFPLALLFPLPRSFSCLILFPNKNNENTGGLVMETGDQVKSVVDLKGKPIIQIGFVVHDAVKMAKRYSEILGIGPWSFIEGKARDFILHDKTLKNMDCGLRIAIAYLG